MLWSVRVRLSMMNIDDANNIATSDEGHRQESFKSVLHQGGEVLEAFVPGCLCGECHNRFMFRHPAGDPFSELHPDAADFMGVRQL